MYTYKVYNLWDELIAQGTTAECAEKLGMTDGGFRNAVKRMRNGVLGNMKIEEFGGPANMEISETKRLAAEWDALVGPIREKYGVPVYKGKGEAGG